MMIKELPEVGQAPGGAGGQLQQEVVSAVLSPSCWTADVPVSSAEVSGLVVQGSGGGLVPVLGSQEPEDCVDNNDK